MGSARESTGYVWRVPFGLAAALAVTSVFSSPTVAQWLVVAGGIVAVGTIARSLGRTKGRRSDRHLLHGGHPVTLITAGLWLAVAGEVLHAGGAGFPSYADAVSLCAYPFVIVGLLRLVQTRLTERSVDTLLVAAIVPAALGAFAWIPLVESLSRRTPGADRNAWVAVVFLVVDGLAVAMVARLTVLFRGRPVADRMLLGAFGALLGAHVSRAAAATTKVVPAPFGSQTLLLVAFGLLAAAALHPSLLPSPAVARRPPAIGRSHVTLMAVAVLLGPAAVLLRAGHVGRWTVLTIAGTGIVSLLVVAHLGRLVHERGRLEYESTHDALTRLPNRLQFVDEIVHATVARRPQFAIGFVDLDRFKKVNDSLGHGAGDDLLRQVAERLRRHVRHDDVVARLAGDEFGLLLANVATAAEAVEIAHRVFAGFDDEFHVGGQSLFITPSIGLSLSPVHGTDPETLLRHADAAMYEAKRLGRNAIEVYSDRLGAAAHQQLAMETRLQIGIGNGELVVHYQPKVSLRTGQVTGVEALVRWDHPTIGLVPPGAFMRLAEETGLVASIGEHVLDAACRQMQAWRQGDFPDLTVSVNLSLRQFNLHDVVAVVSRALEASGLPPHALELELTESSDLNEADAVTHTLGALRALGVRSSIDDFGTGYSGIAYLNDLPIDKIKLDKSFIDTIGADGRDAPLVRAMIAMAHSLDLEVVAEGVETPEQLRFLKAQGCDTIQGYLFSRPLPPGELDALLAEALDPAHPRLQVVRPNGVRDERELGERVWAEAQVEVAALLAAVADDDAPGTGATLARRTLVLSSVAGVMAVPTLLGLTAASALPPAAQTFAAAAFSRIGATPPLHPHGDSQPGRSGDHGSAPRTVEAAARPTGPATTAANVPAVTRPGGKASHDATTPPPSHQGDGPGTTTGGSTGKPADPGTGRTHAPTAPGASGAQHPTPPAHPTLTPDPHPTPASRPTRPAVPPSGKR